MNDPIVEEVRKAREEYAARFNYDLEAMVRDLREQEKLAESKRTESHSHAPVSPGPMPQPQSTRAS